MELHAWGSYHACNIFYIEWSRERITIWNICHRWAGETLLITLFDLPKATVLDFFNPSTPREPRRCGLDMIQESTGLDRKRLKMILHSLSCQHYKVKWVISICLYAQLQRRFWISLRHLRKLLIQISFGLIQIFWASKGRFVYRQYFLAESISSSRSWCPSMTNRSRMRST